MWYKLWLAGDDSSIVYGRDCPVEAAQIFQAILRHVIVITPRLSHHSYSTTGLSVTLEDDPVPFHILRYHRTLLSSQTICDITGPSLSEQQSRSTLRFKL
jgi:hypothetical protein